MLVRIPAHTSSDIAQPDFGRFPEPSHRACLCGRDNRPRDRSYRVGRGKHLDALHPCATLGRDKLRWTVCQLIDACHRDAARLEFCP